MATKYIMCPHCEASFKVTDMKDDKLPAHSFRGKPCSTICAECGGSGKLTQLGGDWGKTPETELNCVTEGTTEEANEGAE